MKKALRILLVLLIAGMIVASVGATQVAADKPKFTGGDNPCKNSNQGAHHPNCPAGKHHTHGNLAPFLLLAPLSLQGRSLESLLD